MSREEANGRSGWSNWTNAALGFTEASARLALIYEAKLLVWNEVFVSLSHRNLFKPLVKSLQQRPTSLIQVKNEEICWNVMLGLCVMTALVVWAGIHHALSQSRIHFVACNTPCLYWQNGQVFLHANDRTIIWISICNFVLSGYRPSFYSWLEGLIRWWDETDAFCWALQTASGLVKLSVWSGCFQDSSQPSTVIEKKRLHCHKWIWTESVVSEWVDSWAEYWNDYGLCVCQLNPIGRKIVI